MGIMWFRGILFGATVSVVALIIFYKSLSPALGVRQPTIIDIGVLRLLAMPFLGGMGIGFVAVVAVLVLTFRILKHYFSA